MTPIELGLTVAVVVLAFVSVTALTFATMDRVEARRTWALANEANDRSIKLAKIGKKHAETDRDVVGSFGKYKREFDEFIKLANASEQKRDERLAALESGLKALEGLFDEMLDRVRELKDQVAGMQVSRVSLTEPTFYRPEAFADVAHHEPRFRTEGEPDPQPAEALAELPDDDQKTDKIAEEQGEAIFAHVKATMFGERGQ